MCVGKYCLVLCEMVLHVIFEMPHHTPWNIAWWSGGYIRKLCELFIIQGLWTCWAFFEKNFSFRLEKVQYCKLYICCFPNDGGLTRISLTLQEQKLCTIHSHGIKSDTLTHELHSGTSKTKACQGGLVRVALIWGPTVQVAFQHGWFCTMWPHHAKGLLAFQIKSKFGNEIKKASRWENDYI